ncbi:UDP-N-acetylglucosamine 2-epimerase [Enterococcus sp. DIV0724b]|uniref:non-hydrolyzing UDP-N-acetylglucosamine 2-epimerase n=1 Tax=Enterococcus sp. DIV0724b TaxID=2774694 RepID=UPI003D2FF007
MNKIKVMTVFGTRPEAIKMCPIIQELEKNNEAFESIVVSTGQHRQMMDQVLSTFRITVDYDLNIMKKNQTLAEITSNVLVKLDDIIKDIQPDVVLVHGDTTTTLTATLAAFYNQVKVGHVEAGLRTGNKLSPFPEEINRRLTDAMADIYFAPTIASKDNLIKENFNSKDIYITGNTAIDALKKTINNNRSVKNFKKHDHRNRLILLTMHRRENQGEPMENVFSVVREIVDSYQDLEVVFPVHLNPRIKKIADKVLDNHNRIHLIDPLDVVDFHNLMASSYMILTDSGGIQEEAPSLGIPVLVLRDTTERPEGVDAGTLKLIGTEREHVKKNIIELIESEKIYNVMAGATNPYGDGTAAQKIVEILKKTSNKL